MSAWIVSRAHIDALVLAGVQWRLITDPGPEKLSALGRMLWAENLASVAYRYPGDGDSERPGPNDFRDADVTTYTAPTSEVLLSAAGVVKAVDCYEYQSCEHPAWPDSAAAGFAGALRTAVLTCIPADQLEPSRYSGQRKYPPGYDTAPWGVDDLTEIAASSVHCGQTDTAALQ
jgi:hypothetical protein